jgi:lipopolysaccharide export system protein LptA
MIVAVGLAVGVAAVSIPIGALAERADRDQPVNIDSDSMVADDAKKIATFDGRVVLTQGTLTIRGDRIVVHQDSNGFQFGVATGKPAKFRQKRDGSDEYFEGEASRIEYDGKLDRVELFENARLHRDAGDDVRGNYISYDAKTESFTVKSAGDLRENGTGRVRAVIMPKGNEPPAAADPAKPRLPSTAGNPRHE